MPPKPMTFKTPDGKEFSTRTEWRDYMMLTFYTFKDKKDEPEPLIKRPGDIAGQMFDIGDCENSTLVVMDNCEQVQIDNCKRNCRIFVGACASSTFIRNCEDCIFYTCSRQLRLRDCLRCTFYVFSLSEVHIETSNGLRFAPFNGGYPEHAEHLQAANLDPTKNLWYDIFDHNDPGKTHENWALIPESEYESMWFPAGACEPAVPRTTQGSVPRTAQEDTMMSFGFNQLVVDAQTIAASSTTLETQPPLPPVSGDSQAPPPLPLPVSMPTVSPAAIVAPVVPFDAAVDSEEFQVKTILNAFVNYVPGGSTKWAIDGLTIVDNNGVSKLLVDPNLTTGFLAMNELWHVQNIVVTPTKDMAWASFWGRHIILGQSETADGNLVFYTAILQKNTNTSDMWKLVHIQRSADCKLNEVNIPKTC